MKRRTYIQGAAGVGASLAVAGCLGGGSPPPRKAAVFEEIQAQSGNLVVQVESSPWVESRAEVQAPTARIGLADATGALGVLGGLSPIGVARGAKGRGAVGRGSRSSYRAAPRSHHGYAHYHGDDDDEWREDHRDEVARYEAVVKTVAIGRMGPASLDEDDLPGVGPLDDWDQTWDVAAGEEVNYDLQRTGWYRVGSKLGAKNASHSFGWEVLDAQVTETASGFEVDSEWKLSPRL